jgi:hypothetical protein
MCLSVWQSDLRTFFSSYISLYENTYWSDWPLLLLILLFRLFKLFTFYFEKSSFKLRYMIMNDMSIISMENIFRLCSVRSPITSKNIFAIGSYLYLNTFSILYLSFTFTIIKIRYSRHWLNIITLIMKKNRI